MCIIILLLFLSCFFSVSLWFHLRIVCTFFSLSVCLFLYYYQTFFTLSYPSFVRRVIHDIRFINWVFFMFLDHFTSLVLLVAKTPHYVFTKTFLNLFVHLTIHTYTHYLMSSILAPLKSRRLVILSYNFLNQVSMYIKIRYVMLPSRRCYIYSYHLYHSVSLKSNIVVLCSSKNNSIPCTWE